MLIVLHFFCDRYTWCRIYFFCTVIIAIIMYRKQQCRYSFLYILEFKDCYNTDIKRKGGSC